jgi:TatD DNase family protein
LVDRAIGSLNQLIDTHCHLDFECFDQDRDVLINGLPACGVKAAIVPAVGKQNWQKVVELADRFEHIYPALGIHPCFLEGAELSHIEDLSNMLQKHNAPGADLARIVAIGECGLDFSLDNVDTQRHYFAGQITLAKQFKLPLIIHHRKSNDIVLAYLRKYKPEYGGIVHAFSGSYQQAKQYIDLGFKLGVGGTITYGRAEKTREVISRVPLDSLVLETDAPDMPIFGRQGERNSPAYLGEIFSVLRLLREESEQEIEQQLLSTSKTIFKLK